MSGLDLSDAFDEEFLESFSVTRQVETLVLGRSQISETVIAPVFGTICIAGPNDLKRLPEGTSFTSGISVVTQTKLQGAVLGYQPDLIEWNGEQFLVVHVDKYGHFGAGWWQVLAESVTSQEPANGY